MNAEFEPTPDFVERVMAQVHASADEKAGFAEWLVVSRPIRYVVASAGTVLGILSAAPAF